MPKFLNTKEAADYLGMSVAWLNKSRHYGTGPQYVKFGKAVRYSVDDLDAWASQHTAEKTSEYTDDWRTKKRKRRTQGGDEITLPKMPWSA